MILHPAEGGSPGHPEAAPPRAAVPAELTALPRWACWRTRTKKCRDRYKCGERTAYRVVYEALHPDTGRPLAASRPDEWVGYDTAVAPKARKPFDGVALLVREEDGLAVVRHAEPVVVAALGPRVVHAEQEVDGDGAVAIVRGEVAGAKTNVFVPLSGRKPCEGAAPPSSGVCPDGSRALSGRKGCDSGLSGRNPYRESGPCPDGTRTFFSSSPQRHYRDGDEGSVRTAVERYAQTVREQGKAGDRDKWVYGLITVLRCHGLTPETLTQAPLLSIAAVVGESAGEVYRLVLARWPSWKANKIPTADALQAVLHDPSLLTGLPPVLGDPELVRTAAMCKFMGEGGHPFPLSGRVLAEVLGLSGQQAGSEVINALLTLGLIRRVKEGNYSTGMAAEYVWVAAGSPSEAAPAPAPAPLPTRSSRPGHSPEQTPEFCMKSRMGGFLTPEHYLAEWMLIRKLGREGQDLPEMFWMKPGLGPDYARQVVAARALLESFSMSAICKALRSKEGCRGYSLAATFIRPLVQAEQEQLDRRAAVGERMSQELAESAPRPATAAELPSAPRPALTKPNLLQKLKGL